MGSVTRRMISFPGVNGQRVAFASGVPGPSVIGGAAACPADIASGYALNYSQLADRSAQRIDLSGQGHTHGPVRAIGIAADSAIACCDIALHGKMGEIDRVRISPGNPLIGSVLEADFALITIPESIAPTARLARAVFWDSIEVIDPGDPSVSFSGYPLRLDLFRGDVLPMRTHRRAPYVAHMVGTSTGTIGQSRYLYVCVDGRRRIDVTVDNTGANSITVSMNSLVAGKVIGNPDVDYTMVVPLPITSAGALTVAQATGAATYSFNGNPITILQISIGSTTEAAATFFQIHVRAED